LKGLFFRILLRIIYLSVSNVGIGLPPEEEIISVTLIWITRNEKEQKMKKALAIVPVLTLTAGAALMVNGGSEGGKDDKLVIGITLMSLRHPFFQERSYA